MLRVLILTLILGSAFTALFFGILVVSGTLQPECSGNTVNVGGQPYTAVSCR